MRIMPVAALLADSAIGAMDDQLATLIACNLSRTSDRIVLAS
jgi:hypothetical protein